jgi:parallel beta-helix repeat protein
MGRIVAALRAAGLAGLMMGLMACSQGSAPREVGAPRDLTGANTAYQEELIEALIDAQPGDVISVPAGVFVIDQPLALTVDNVTIRGAGMNETVLNFRGLTSGAQGLLVTADNFTIEDIGLEDAPGDLLKVNDAENVVIRRVRAEWTNGPSHDNGAYGLYPVQVRNLLVEDCVAIGASDAGVYVGQSQNVVVRRNRAEFNVAGIEIENTVDADVYENFATNNTGGILVFNMPQLSQRGERTRVYNNQVFANNTDNFGHAGTPVASVPAGTGVIINSNDAVEIFDNDILDHKTANIIVSSLFSAGYQDAAQAENFDPYPEGILIQENRFSGGGDAPDMLELQALRVAMFGLNGRLPDIVWDGYVNPTVEGPRLCVDNGEALVLNIDGQNGNANPTTAMEAHQCTLPRLAPVMLRPPLGP